MRFSRLMTFVVIVPLLMACGDEAPKEKMPISRAEAPSVSQPSSAGGGAVEEKSTGGVTVKILPENPTSTDCLTAIVKGIPGRSGVVWKVNSEVVATGTRDQLCDGSYQRDDRVTIEVGTIDKGAQATVTIVNSLPRVVGISSTPDEIFAGTDVTVTPVAEDADGDDVSFTYQWVINGEEDPDFTEDTLPGNRFTKGDSLQVLIVPNDFYEDGPVYESYATPVPNAPPAFISEPPQEFTSLNYRYKVATMDPDDTELTYRLDEAPDGMVIDAASGLISWSLADVSPGDYTVAIIVTDPEGAESAQEYTLSLGEPQ